MKYYSRKRIVWSIVVSVLIPLYPVDIILYGSGKGPKELFFTYSFVVIVLLGILLPKIWWNFVLDRIREIAKAIKDT